MGAVAVSRKSLIHMKPMGNTPYTAGTAGERESESRSRSLVESLGKRFLRVLLNSDLDKIAGDEDVQLGQASCRLVKPNKLVSSRWDLSSTARA